MRRTPRIYVAASVEQAHLLKNLQRQGIPAYIDERSPADRRRRNSRSACRGPADVGV